MNQTESFQLTASGRTLHGLVTTPAGSEPLPVVVVSHGFKGFMEWGFHPHTAESLTTQGFAVVRFNFSGSGMLPGEDRVTDPDGFRNARITHDLEDLLNILSHLDSLPSHGKFDLDRISLLGHSRGGGIALLAAADPNWSDRIRSLVTWSAVSTFDRVSKEEVAYWHQQGEITIVNARTGQELPIGLVVLEDYEANRERLDLSAAAGRRSAPWLIIHGTEDETVPIAEARKLESAASLPKELREVSDGSHTYGATHPFRGSTHHLEEVLAATVDWLHRHTPEQASR